MRACFLTLMAMFATILCACVKTPTPTNANLREGIAAQRVCLTGVRRAFTGIERATLERLVTGLQVAYATGSVYFEAKERMNPDSKGRIYPNVGLTSGEYLFVINVFDVVMDVELVEQANSNRSRVGEEKRFDSDGIREFTEPISLGLSFYTSSHLNRRLHVTGYLDSGGIKVGTWHEFSADGRLLGVREYR